MRSSSIENCGTNAAFLRLDELKIFFDGRTFAPFSPRRLFRLLLARKIGKSLLFPRFLHVRFPATSDKNKIYTCASFSFYCTSLFAAPTPHFNGYFNFFSSLHRTDQPKPARLHQEEKPKAETFTPSTVQKLPLSIIKAVFPAFMNLSFEWRSFSFAARFGFPFRSCFPLQSGAGAVPRPPHKRKFLPPLQAPALKNGDLVQKSWTLILL